MQSPGSQRINGTLTSLVQPNALWRSFLNHLSARCANEDCPRRNRLWPSWTRTADGIQFDGKWYCGFFCSQAAIRLRVGYLLATFVPETPRHYRFPVGLLLMKEGLLSSDQLRRALDLQREKRHVRLGDLLLEAGFVTESQLTQVLSRQWGCPVFPLDPHRESGSPISTAPLPVLQSACAAPVHLSPDSGTLHIAFGDYVDHTLLYGIEQILNCRTVACTASRNAVTRLLDLLRQHPDRAYTSFDSILDPSEIVSIIGNYSQELRASHIQLARAASFLWVRFRRAQSSRDLLFRAMPDQARVSSPHAAAISHSLPGYRHLSASASGS